MAKAERCTAHLVTNPVKDCDACQYRERLAIVLFQKDVWCNSEPDAEPRRWDVDDECPEWQRDDYRYLADAALELMLPDFSAAEQRGRDEERERLIALVCAMLDEMKRDAEEQGVPFDGDEGMYRGEVETLRVLQRRFLGVGAAARQQGGG